MCNTNNQEKLIVKAEKLIKNTHIKKYLCSNHSYYSHVLRVKELLLSIDTSDHTLSILGLLHHVDEFDLLSEVKSKFDSDVSFVLSKYYNLDLQKYVKTSGNKKKLIESILALISSLDDSRILFLILADRVAISEKLVLFSQKERKVMAKENLYFYASICRLLGLNNFLQKLEDNSFKTLYGREYFNVSKLIKNIKRNKYEKIKDFENFINLLISEHKNLKNYEINHRIKSAFSFYKKYDKHLRSGRVDANDYTSIYDLVAFRIMVPTVDDCYKIEALINDACNNLVDERDDYIKNPKANGYRSIHQVYEIAKETYIEVQIKTFEMHNFNEFGSASHIFYKFKAGLKDLLNEIPNLIKDLNYETMLKTNASDTFLADYVYVFTPKGDIKKLKFGATPVDFAYFIHSNVGHRCTGAHVNDSLVPLDYKLKSGDTIKIKLAKRNKKPSYDWLNFVVEKRSKHYINKALKIE